MMNRFDKRELKKVQKYLNALPEEKKIKLKAHLKTHCIHNVAFSATIPCLRCLSDEYNLILWL
jgi:hypothetical protein